MSVCPCVHFNERGRGPPPSRLIDDEGAKRKVRSLIANIGNYATLACGRRESWASTQALPTAFIPWGPKRDPMITR